MVIVVLVRVVCVMSLIAWLLMIWCACVAAGAPPPGLPPPPPDYFMPSMASWGPPVGGIAPPPGVAPPPGIAPPPGLAPPTGPGGTATVPLTCRGLWCEQRLADDGSLCFR